MEAKPIEQKKDDSKEKPKTENAAQSAADYYWNWIKANTNLTANDAAV